MEIDRSLLAPLIVSEAKALAPVDRWTARQQRMSERRAAVVLQRADEWIERRVDGADLVVADPSVNPLLPSDLPIRL